MSKKRKTFLFQGLDKSFKEVKPLTDSQMDTVDAYQEGYNLLLHGVAGTGKTFIALWLALQDLINGKFEKIIIIRSAVSSRDMGFLPGTIEEKSKPFEDAYVAIVNELFQRGDAWNVLVEKNIIEFKLTGHLRSLTINNAIILVDEIQNMNFQELDTVITRVGKNSKIIFCGDDQQNDLYRSKYDFSGLDRFIEILEEMESFDKIEFGIEDIVRSGLVKEYLLTKMRLGS